MVFVLVVDMEDGATGSAEDEVYAKGTRADAG